MSGEAALSTRKSVAWWFIFVACGTLYLFHFSIVQLANMPLSPLKLSLEETIQGYLTPYFFQRWSFFAPQPIDRDTFLLSRARFRDPQTGKDVTTPWVNVSAPLFESVKRNRLTPLFLVEIGLSNAVIDYQNYLATDNTASFKKDGQTYFKAIISSTIDPLDLSIMTRTALSTLEINYPGTSFEAIQLGLGHHIYPRFTERHRREVAQEMPVTLIDWQPASPVSPYCCP